MGGGDKKAPSPFDFLLERGGNKNPLSLKERVGVRVKT